MRTRTGQASIVFFNRTTVFLRRRAFVSQAQVCASALLLQVTAQFEFELTQGFNHCLLDVCGRGGVTIDVEHYKHRNEERIMNMAQRMGDRVRETGNSITLEPMSAAERRLVHVLFADDPELETNSVGEGENRKVVISLK